MRNPAPGSTRRRAGGALLLVCAGLFLVLFFPVVTVQWLGFTALLIVGLSYAWSRIVTARMVISRPPDDLVTYRYEDAVVTITIRNRSFLPIPHLVVNDNPGTLYSGWRNSRLLSLRPRESRTLSYPIRGMNRGAYRIGPVTVTHSDPLGLFAVQALMPAEVLLVVYPTIHPVNIPLDAGLPTGTVTAVSRVYEDPTRYRSVREYTPGDEVRRINWKVSARTGRLHSTEWMPTLTFPVLCLLNLTPPDYERRHRYGHTERTIDAAASLVHHLAGRGQPVGLVTTGVLEDGVRPVIPVSDGSQHAVTILKTLARIESGDSESDIVSVFLGAGVPAPGTRVFYLGPPLTPERVAALLTGVAHRAMVRLHYTDENVVDWRALAVEAVSLWRITETGDELFVPQA